MENGDLIDTAEKAMNVAVEVMERVDGWTVVKEAGISGATVSWREGVVGDTNRLDGEAPDPEWRCWRVQQELDTDVDTVSSIIMDIDNMYRWNPALTHTKVLEKLDEKTFLSYQITEGRRPIVQPRDFVFVCREERRGEDWLAGGCSVVSARHPPTDRCVRAWQHPGVMVASPLPAKSRTLFTWILQCDFGGLLPTTILNIALPYAVKLFCNSLKSEVKKRSGNK